MKTTALFACLLTFGAGLTAGNCAEQNLPDAGAQLKSFATEKETQARALVSSSDKGLPAEFQPFFSAVQNSDWESLSNNYFAIKNLINTDSAYHRSWWQPVVEVYGAEEQLKLGNGKYFTTYANDIIQSIPPGSIYFGGTDPGRFIVTAMQKSQIQGDPFFTLTQNALADGTYLDYLRSEYGTQIYLPSAEDSQKCFNDYYADVQRRMQRSELEPGEDVTTDPMTGKMTVSGQVAVMTINGRMVKMIFEKEPSRDFYVEESFPLQWMYPYLEPHGLIFKLNHEPLAGLSDEMVQRDHDYWVKTVSPFIGDWLKDDTSVTDVAAFVEKVFVQHDLDGFTGDPVFVECYAHRVFSKERSSSGGLFAWRAQNAAEETEKERMASEADFAFRQSWAMCPNSPEAVFRYVQFLMSSHRIDDALIITRTSLEVDPKNASIADLLRNLENYKRQASHSAQSKNQIQAEKEEAKKNPTDYVNLFALAGYYLQTKQTNQAAELMEDAISRPGMPVQALRTAAQFFAQQNDYPHLETVLEKITVANPGVPESFYDLARVQVLLGKNDDAVKSLDTAVYLSDQRLQTNSGALNIRKVARTDTSFKAIRDMPAFQKVVSQ
jgi:tetratricopeptide (TPR) repeat protein